MDILEFSTVLAQTSDHSILKIAAKRGLQYPSPHLALFKSVYAKMEEANGNGVRLATKAVEESLPTLVGKQVNFNHQRQNAICGYILDAWLNKKTDEIEICFAFFKDVYPDEYQEAIDLMEEGKLTVSFELNSEKSTQEHLQDGSRRLNDINFAGVGLLLNEKPAYAGAIVFETAKKAVSYIFNPNGDLVFANKNECQELMKALSSVLDNNLNEGELNMEKELRIAESINDDVQNPMAKKLSYQEKKNLPDSSYAVVITKEGRKIRKFPIHDAAHVRNALARLGQEPTKKALQKLGVSVESVTKKVLARAKALGLNDLVKKHEKANQVETAFQDSVTCKKCGARFDWNSYVNAEKTSAECPGCKDMVDLNGVTVKAKEGDKMASELKIETQKEMEQKIDEKVALDAPVKQEAPQPAGTDTAEEAKKVCAECGKPLVNDVCEECKKASQVPQTPLPDKTNEQDQKKMEVKVEEKQTLEAPAKPEEKAPIIPEADRKLPEERQAEAIAEDDKAVASVVEEDASKSKKEINRVETTVVTPDGKSNTTSVKHTEHTQHVDSEGKPVSTHHVEHNHKETYTMAEMEEVKKELASMKAVVEEYQAAVPAEVMKMIKDGKSMKEAWAEYKKDLKKASETIGQLKAELDPKFTTNWSDEDYLNPDKVENARLKQENAQLKASQVMVVKEEKAVETASEVPAVDLETGHDAEAASKTAQEKVDVCAAINSRVKLFRGKAKK